MSKGKFILFKNLLPTIIFILMFSAFIYLFYQDYMCETIVPKYPKKFDTFIIEGRYPKCFFIHKNQEVMDFISKTNRLSEHIYDSDGGCIRFMSGNKAVYALPYGTAIDYPNSAIEIIENLKHKAKKYYLYIDKEDNKIKKINYFKVYTHIDDRKFHFYIFKKKLTNKQEKQYGFTN